MMKYILNSFKAQFSRGHLWIVTKAIFSFIGLSVTFLQALEYLLPKEYSQPVVDFCKGNLKYEISGLIVIVLAYNWKRLGYFWKCRNMEVAIEIKCCDFFKQEGSKLIQFSDTFDTDVYDKKIVKKSSLNGQFIVSFFGDSLQELDHKIYETLDANNVKPSKNPKLKGKKLVYSIGTVMHLEYQGQNYILTAFSRMRPNGNSSMSRITYTDFLSALWKKLAVINVKDETLNITVFGASSISGLLADFSYQDKLHEIVKSFLLASKNQRLCKKLRICMTADDYRQLDYEDIKSLAAYFDSHLSQLDLKSSHTERRRGVSFKPLLKGVL